MLKYEFIHNILSEIFFKVRDNITMTKTELKRAKQIINLPIFRDLAKTIFFLDQNSTMMELIHLINRKEKDRKISKKFAIKILNAIYAYLSAENYNCEDVMKIYERGSNLAYDIISMIGIANSGIIDSLMMEDVAKTTNDSEVQNIAENYVNIVQCNW